MSGFQVPCQIPCPTCANGTDELSLKRAATIEFDDLNWHTRRYGTGSGGYEQSKLANLLFTLELQRRLEGSGSPVIATAAHPGMTATNLMSSSRSPVMTAFAKAVTEVTIERAYEEISAASRMSCA